MSWQYRAEAWIVPKARISENLDSIRRYLTQNQVKFKEEHTRIFGNWEGFNFHILFFPERYKGEDAVKVQLHLTYTDNRKRIMKKIDGFASGLLSQINKK